MGQVTLVNILSRADLEPPPVFSSDDIREWPAELQGILEGSSILQEASSALSAVCDGCEQACIEDVQYLDRKGKNRGRTLPAAGATI